MPNPNEDGWPKKSLTQLLPHCHGEPDRIDSTPRQSEADMSHFSDPASILTKLSFPSWLQTTRMPPVQQML